MRRRRFVTLLAIGAIVPLRVRAVPPREFGVEDFAAVSFSGNEGDTVKSVTARTSVWRDDEAAAEHRQVVLHGAGWVPSGEFYSTTPVAAPIPAGFEDAETGFATWQTIVGAAGVQTDWALLVWREGLVVGEVLAGTQPDGPAASLAAELATVIRERLADDAGLTEALPVLDDLPDGMEVTYLMTPDGTTNGDGTPIPAPEESPVP
jgi:hypothetical protein